MKTGIQTQSYTIIDASEKTGLAEPITCFIWSSSSSSSLSQGRESCTNGKGDAVNFPQITASLQLALTPLILSKPWTVSALHPAVVFYQQKFPSFTAWPFETKRLLLQRSFYVVGVNHQRAPATQKPRLTLLFS